MALSSALIYLVATVLLIHATYSAYEFSLFRKHHTTAVTDLGLPVDALLGMALAILGPILSAVGSLKPAQFATAMVQVEKEGNNPFLGLETRPIFADLAAKRQQFQEWRKSQ